MQAPRQLRRETNMHGTPADRSTSASAGTWSDQDGATLNYRASIKNVAFKDDPEGCADGYADGSDAPKGCKIGSFYTRSSAMRWQATQKLEVFGSINNLYRTACRR